MSEKYKIRDHDKIYFVTFAVTEWVDVFTRNEYKEIVIDSLKHCQERKGLEIYSWCLMSNHIHLIIGRVEKGLTNIEDIVRDLKNILQYKFADR